MKTGISSSVTIVLAVVALLIGAGIGYLAAPSSSTVTSTVSGTTVTTTVGGSTVTTTVGAGTTVTNTVTNTVTTTTGGGGGGLSGTIQLGAIYSLSGDTAFTGQQEKVATQFAVDDLNAYLKNSSTNLQFNVKLEDDQTDASVALTEVQALVSQGVKEILGPTNSGEARNVISYANANHIVLLTPSSSAPDLAIPNDYLFRNVPTDAVQSAAIARNVIQQGYNYVIIVYRNDAYGTGVNAGFQQHYTAEGGTVLDDIPYTVITTGSYDFSAQLAQMNTDYQSAVAKYGADHVAIESIMFNEEATMIAQLSSYSAIAGARWFACDGIALSTIFLQGAGSLSPTIKLDATYSAPTRSPIFAAFEARFKAATGQEPSAVTAAAYDDVWIMARAIIDAGTTDGAVVKNLIIPVANSYFGAAGWPNFNAAGDKQTSNYDIYQVQLVSGSPTWVLIGNWDPIADSVTYSAPH